MEKQKKQHIVFIAGPSCSGKSSLAKILARQEGGIRLSADQIRANIYNYKSNSEEHQKIRHQFFLTMLHLFLSSNHSNDSQIFCEVPRSLMTSLELFIYLAIQYRFKVLIVFLDAPDDILLARFQARLEDSSEKGYILAVNNSEVFLTNKEETREKIQSFLKEGRVPQNCVYGMYHFNTEKFSREELSTSIMEMISSED